jgi:two-component system, LuxR family, response regulator FixJ
MAIGSEPGKGKEKPRRIPRAVTFVGDSGKHTMPLAASLENEGYLCQHFASHKDFLAILRKHNCDMVVTSISRADTYAFELLSSIKADRPELPVIVVTPDGNIPLAVQAIKLGAKDFVVAGTDDASSTLARIAACFEQTGIMVDKMPDVLTHMEQMVLKTILLGLSNRATAERLGLSVRTVEDHRRRMMEKLGVTNIVELVKLCVTLGVVRTDSTGRGMSETQAPDIQSH